MSQPRVEQIDYRVVSEVPERWDLSDLRPLVVRLGDFECSVSDGTLTARPLGDYGDAETARAALEPLLDSWAAVIELDSQVPVRFRYAGARLSPVAAVDEHGNVTMVVSAGDAIAFGEVASVLIKNTTLPPPSPTFVETADLRRLRERIRDYNLGRERLLALGYFAYTTFTGRYGGKRNAPSRMNVEPAVLEKLNELTSQRTDPQHGRKAIKGPPLTGHEHTWVLASVIALAKRMGEIEGGASPPLLTMTDLPRLK